MTCIALRMRWARSFVMPLIAACTLNASLAHAQSVILPEGMTISLQTRQDISSKSAREGDQVELAVAKAVTIGGVTIIPAGAPATGEVARVSDNGLLGRSGKLDIRVNTVKAGQLDVPIRGERNMKGRSGTLGSVGAGIVFLPLAILVRGKDVKLPAGTTFDVYVDKEVVITPMATMNDIRQSEAPSQPSVIRSIDPNDALAR